MIPGTALLAELLVSSNFMAITNEWAKDCAVLDRVVVQRSTSSRPAQADLSVREGESPGTEPKRLRHQGVRPVVSHPQDGSPL